MPLLGVAYLLTDPQRRASTLRCALHERVNVLSKRAKDERTGPDRRPSCTSTSSPASWMVTWERWPYVRDRFRTAT
jgi:hypothetical protein